MTSSSKMVSWIWLKFVRNLPAVRINNNNNNNNNNSSSSNDDNNTYCHGNLSILLRLSFITLLSIKSQIITLVSF